MVYTQFMKGETGWWRKTVTAEALPSPLTGISGEQTTPPLKRRQSGCPGGAVGEERRRPEKSVPPRGREVRPDGSRRREAGS